MNPTTKVLRATVTAVSAAVLFLSPELARAIKPQGVSEGEIALLPEYCIDTEAFIYGSVGNPGQSPKAPMWVERMGPTFKGMHHYCWGLVNLNRLKSGRANTGDKKYFAKQIVDEYMYVIRVATPDFILLPELWTRIGEASLLADDVGTALDAYARARKIKPDYWPAYTQWADFLLRYGKKADAKALLQTGLEYAPDSPELAQMFKKLGGDPATVMRRSSFSERSNSDGQNTRPPSSPESPASSGN